MYDLSGGLEASGKPMYEMISSVAIAVVKHTGPRTSANKGVDADKRLSGQRLSVSACRPVEHPCWNFQPTFCLPPIQRAAKDGIISLVDGLMNANSATKPRMMPIKNLPKNGPVGVLKRCCIIVSERIDPEQGCARHSPNSANRKHQI